ncbi:MAG: hypothetical protein V2J12_00710 [Gammaproteobacteria bacterium]|jgi:hypothetical protein|nr:hypothetical protein [Gammaproteobacteria bacterium]
MTIDPAWEGQVQFYELLYGTWLAYLFLVLLFEKAFRQPLDEWRYVLINFIGAGAFWVNHYFQRADFWLTLINLYTLAFIVVWYFVCVRPARRPRAWQVGATFAAILYTAAFIGFENIARYGVDTAGIAEFWFMLAAYIGFVGIIVWRGTRTAGMPKFAR